MKAATLWEQYQYYTRDVTEHSRKLGFAVAAICWFFKSATVTFPTPILWSLVFVVVFFGLDLLQSLTGAICVRCFTRSQERKMWKEKQTIDDEIKKPDWVDYPSFTLFLLKMTALFGAFVSLVIEFCRRLSP